MTDVIDEPTVAWIAFAANGRIQFWTRDGERAELEKSKGRDLRAFTLTELVSLTARPSALAITAEQFDASSTRVYLPRWWLQKVSDQLAVFEPLPSGHIGDWLFLFREIVKDILEAAPAPEKRDLTLRLRDAANSLHLPPSIQSQRLIRVMNDCDEAAREIELLRAQNESLTRALGKAKP